MPLHQQGFRFKLRPNGQQSRLIRRFCGCARFVFNQALEWTAKQKEKDSRFRFSYFKASSLLPIWKTQWPWLKECHSQVLQQSLKDLGRAFQNLAAGNAEFPKFKKKGRREGIRFPQGFLLDQGNSRIYLPKIGWVRYIRSRNIAGQPKNVTVRLESDGIYVSIQTEMEQEIPVHTNPGGEVGIDMGVARFATLSNGEFFAPLNALKTDLEKLAKLQKKLKNKTKFGKNWQKLNKRIGRLHRRIFYRRRNFLHQITNIISKNHAMIYIEDLKVKNMTKSAKGTAENPGSHVKQKTGLNRSVLDQGWYEFCRQLKYKALWRGGYVFEVPPQNTSRTCPACGYVSAGNRLSQAHFRCLACGYEENADLVGAVNVLNRGRELAAA